MATSEVSFHMLLVPCQFHISIENMALSVDVHIHMVIFHSHVGSPEEHLDGYPILRKSRHVRRQGPAVDMSPGLVGFFNLQTLQDKHEM